jgi:ferredoxin-type protein NapH
LVCLGLATQFGVGTLSSWGIANISALCPLGALEAAIASKTMVPAGVIGLAIIVVIILITGRAFCAWGCPVPLLRRLFGLKSPQERAEARMRKAAHTDKTENTYEHSPTSASSTQEKCSSAVNAGIFNGLNQHCQDDLPTPERGGLSDSRNWVLGGALISTALFGFPVFCLICPVGLTFATLIVLWRTFQFGEITFSLLVFPLLLIVEVVILRRWCHTLCPLGALISLISRGNKTFNAQIDSSKCLNNVEGISCERCTSVCSEGIDLHDAALSTPHHECTKCGECKHACPVQAISFPFLKKKNKKSTTSNNSLRD